MPQKYLVRKAGRDFATLTQLSGQEDVEFPRKLLEALYGNDWEIYPVVEPEDYGCQKLISV